ncbi:MAG: MCE family protein [Hormoscilla sp. GUM202]|nr:MCE family protein [Hormoscilla sp. GUM202]
MRKQMVREGTTGLMILAGIGVFGILFLWLRGFGFGQGSYETVVEFKDVGRMRVGATVRYRGVQVGRIIKIAPKPNSVDVTLEISPAEIIIPSDVLIEANQSGIVGETSVDIIPRKALPTSAQIPSPLDPNCDSSVIICDGARLQGETGISYDELLRSTIKASDMLANPEFFTKLDRAVEQIGNAADGVNQLTGDISKLTISVDKQLNTFSETAQTMGKAADRISVSAAELTDQLTISTAQLTDRLNTTTAQANKLLANMNDLVSSNRSSLVNTLNNIQQTSEDLRVAVNSLTPIINKVEQGDLVANLEVLSSNAAEASANLRDISKEINNPTNVLMMQQTLDSARATFQNIQKITSDVEELTGDPVFRDNLRNLVNGLSGLVSQTEQLQQQAEVIQRPDSLNQEIKSPVAAEIGEQEMIEPEL